MRLYLTTEEKLEIGHAMDRSRTGEAKYRRPFEDAKAANGHAARSLSTYWDRYGWKGQKTPVGARAIDILRTGMTPEQHARQARVKCLKELSKGWRDRAALVVDAASGLSREVGTPHVKSCLLRLIHFGNWLANTEAERGARASSVVLEMFQFSM